MHRSYCTHHCCIVRRSVDLWGFGSFGDLPHGHDLAICADPDSDTNYVIVAQYSLCASIASEPFERNSLNWTREGTPDRTFNNLRQQLRPTCRRLNDPACTRTHRRPRPMDGTFTMTQPHTDFAMILRRRRAGICASLTRSCGFSVLPCNFNPLRQ